MGVGACALLLFARMDYRKWRKIRGALVVVTMGLLVVVLVPHLGVSAGGSSRWIGFGMLQVQPSELMKLALAVFAADLLTRRTHAAADPKTVIVPVLAVLGISGVLILKQPDMGTALVLGCIAFGILFMGGVPMAPILKLLAAFAGLALVVGLADPYRRDRILSFLNPGANKSGTGYQVWQSLIGLGSGHIFGLGPGGRPGEVGHAAQRPHRLHLLGGRRGARPDRRRRAPRPVLRPGLVRAAGRHRAHRTGSAACWPWASPPGSPARR